MANDMTDWNLIISGCALSSSIAALLISSWFWFKQFRPIVSAMVVTRTAGNTAVAYNLQVINCGSLPARNISLTPDPEKLAQAIQPTAQDVDKNRWLACFGITIPLLHNGVTVTCSFGDTGTRPGFWIYGSEIPIKICYEGFWWKKYAEDVTLKIMDSTSFTGFSWD